MKIGIDISQVVYEGTGVGRFTKGLIETILTFDKTNHWTFFFSSFRGKIDSELLSRIKKSRHRFLRLPFSPRMLSFLWNTVHMIPIETFTGPLDVFICSDWTEPPAKCKKATIIHDFAYLRYPETVHESILKTQKKRMEWVKKESQYIITPSKSTQSDVSKFFSIPSEKITPLYSGVTIQVPEVKDINRIIQKFHLFKPFILTVGKVEPRKNIARLIEAFLQTKKEDWELVVVGPGGWGDVPVDHQSSAVHFTGFVTEQELHALYQLCQFFVLPSLWEGFGYPVLEAMQHKKAVAASDNSSLKELVENHGVLFNPLSSFDISASLATLMHDKKVRSECEQKGYDFSQQFTWKRYYEGLMKTLHVTR